MANITENLQTLKDSGSEIKSAIEDMGGIIEGNITTWARAIRNLPTGGSGSGKGDVNFYDYDGTILHSYSKDAFLALTTLPDLPTQPGLTCQGWNYDITKAKTYVTEYGKLDIGATYITDDGKTRLYIKIAAEGRMTVPLYFNQSVANGVTIDWGDDSATQTLSETGNLNISHTYNNIGDYCITLKVTSGTLSLGHNNSYPVLGSDDNNAIVYCNMLQRVEIGTGVTSIGSYVFKPCYSLSSVVIPSSVTSIGYAAFNRCYSLSSVVIPSSVTSINGQVFQYCYSLSSIVIPSGVKSIDGNTLQYCYSLSSVVIPSSVTSIGGNMFSNCYSLSSIVIPSGVTSIGSYAFQNCYGMAFYDFSTHTAVSTLSNTNAFTGIPSDCKIIVPDSLYDAWKAATNWSTYASKIIKKFEIL